jgi:hypothetical protein
MTRLFKALRIIRAECFEFNLLILTDVLEDTGEL